MSQPTHRKILASLDKLPLAAVCAEPSGSNLDTTYIHWKTAEAMEAQGLIKIKREIDGDGLKAWEPSLTKAGRELIA